MDIYEMLILIQIMLLNNDFFLIFIIYYEIKIMKIIQHFIYLLNLINSYNKVIQVMNLIQVNNQLHKNQNHLMYLKIILMLYNQY